MVRINGTMQPLNMDPLKQEDIESILPQILDEDQLHSFEKNKEIDFSASLEGKGRFRVNFFNQIKGMAGVFRTIPEVVKDFDDLGIPPVLRSLALLNRGLVLLTGPTGSGKTTTSVKLAKRLIDLNKSVLLVAADIYRPGAIKQLNTLAKQINVPVFEMDNSDPVKISSEAVKEAKNSN